MAIVRILYTLVLIFKPTFSFSLVFTKNIRFNLHIHISAIITKYSTLFLCTVLNSVMANFEGYI